MKKGNKCFFSSNIAEELTCSPIPEFDDLGFPIVYCDEFPCDKYKKIVPDIEEKDREYQVTVKVGKEGK
jgi:hypothetical protein